MYQYSSSSAGHQGNINTYFRWSLYLILNDSYKYTMK